MLNNKILDCASRLIEAQFTKRRRVLPDNIGCILLKMQIVGMANSSSAGKAVCAACEEEIDERAKIIWADIQRSHKDFGAPITNTLAKDLKQEVNIQIEKIVKYASELMAERLRLKEPNAYLLDLEKTKNAVKKEYDTEVDLYVASLKHGNLTETEQDIKQKNKTGQGETKRTPKTDTSLIYQCDAEDFYNIPKSMLSKASKKTPGEPGYLWSDTEGRRRFYLKKDLEKISRSRQKLQGH